eukprot:4109668-Amphidinium_carterae.1
MTTWDSNRPPPEPIKKRKLLTRCSTLGASSVRPVLTQYMESSFKLVEPNTVETSSRSCSDAEDHWSTCCSAHRWCLKTARPIGDKQRWAYYNSVNHSILGGNIGPRLAVS